MSFVYGILTDEEKCFLIEKYNLINSYTLKKSVVLKQQAFDFERDMRFFPLYKMKECELAVFVFIFKEKLCSMCAYYQYKRKKDGCVSINWDIIKFYCPKDIGLMEDELISFVRDAFYVLNYGFSLGVNETIIEKVCAIDYIQENPVNICQNYLARSVSFAIIEKDFCKNRYPIKFFPVTKSPQAGFVYSIITNEEKKELMNKYNFEKINKNHFSTNVYSITYHARLILMLGQELHGNAPAVLAFIWEDNLCCILAYQRYIKHSDIIDSIQWDIESIHVPKKLECQKDKLLFLLKEAFEAFKVDEKNKIILGEIKKLEFEDKKGWYYE